MNDVREHAEGKRLPGRTICGWKGNIAVDVREMP
jgi:hypothetical protein